MEVSQFKRRRRCGKRKNFIFKKLSKSTSTSYVNKVKKAKIDKRIDKFINGMAISLNLDSNQMNKNSIKCNNGSFNGAIQDRDIHMSSKNKKQNKSNFYLKFNKYADKSPSSMITTPDNKNNYFNQQASNL